MTTYSAVVTTGIYCRPGCAGRPLAQNVRTFDHPAAAEAAGFRACHRCRPYRVAGPVTTGARELVCEAVQQIIGGVMDDGGTEAVLAARIGLSARHLRRLFLRHLGVSPDQLARSRRAHFARRLLDDTDLTVLDIALHRFRRRVRQPAPVQLGPGQRRNRCREAARTGKLQRTRASGRSTWARGRTGSSHRRSVIYLAGLGCRVDLTAMLR